MDVFVVEESFECAPETAIIGVYDDFWLAVKGILEYAEGDFEEGDTLQPHTVFESWEDWAESSVIMAIFDEDGHGHGTYYEIYKTILNKTEGT